MAGEVRLHQDVWAGYRWDFHFKAFSFFFLRHFKVTKTQNSLADLTGDV